MTRPINLGSASQAFRLLFLIKVQCKDYINPNGWGNDSVGQVNMDDSD